MYTGGTILLLRIDIPQLLLQLFCSQTWLSSPKARSHLYLSTVLGLCENPMTSPAASPVSERSLEWALRLLLTFSVSNFAKF